MKDVKELDLNLMKVLKAVVEEGNTHAAADALGISQTSVSRALAKLRETFGDQLFIRKAHGVEPSELAEKLAEASDEMFQPLIKVVESYQSFDPLEFDGEVKLALHIFFLETFGDGILDALTKALPKAKFHITYWQQDTLTDVLNGNIDYLLQFDQYPLPQDIYQHHLQDVKLCLVARKNHPVLSQGSEWENIHHVPLCRVLIDGINTKRAKVEEVYLAKGYQPNVSLVTHSVKVLLNKIKSSDAITFGSTFMTNGEPELQNYPLPALPVDARQIQIVGGYLQSRRGFPLNQLLHQVMQNYFDSVEQPGFSKPS